MKLGKEDNKSRLPVADGRFTEASGGGSNGDRGVSRACHGRGRPPRRVSHTEALVSACVHTGSQPLLEGHGKGRGGFTDPLSEGGATPPPGLPLCTHVKTSKVKDEIPLEAEVGALVRRLLPHRAGGHTHLRAEQFKQWQKEDYPGEQSKTPRGGNAGRAW